MCCCTQSCRKADAQTECSSGQGLTLSEAMAPAAFARCTLRNPDRSLGSRNCCERPFTRLLQPHYSGRFGVPTRVSLNLDCVA